ncbi:MAG: glycosyltransferase family 4 protein [Candidatus Promineifilaceae bacterium]
MNLLFLTSRLPYPPDRGDRLRAFNFLKQFAAEHEVTLVAFAAKPAELAHLPALRPYCAEIEVIVKSAASSVASAALSSWRSLPLQALYYRSRPMQRRLDGLLAERNFEAAYVHLFRMAPYLAGAEGIYRILDLTDIISREIRASLPFRPRHWSALYRQELPRIERYERQLATLAEEVWLASEVDRSLLQAAVPGANVQVVPNGLNLERLDAAEPDFGQGEGLLFSGHMGVFHNIDAAEVLARDILPRVRKTYQHCELRIVGASPAAAVRALDPLPGVSVTGYVPDLGAELRRTAVFVAPLRFAAGVQNKIIEALAAGRAVVTMPAVCQGLGATPGRHLMVADEPEQAAAIIIQLLGDPEERRRLGQAGREFVLTRFTWQVAAERMQRVAERLAADE